SCGNRHRRSIQYRFIVEFLPTAGTTAAFNFRDWRHVPLAAQNNVTPVAQHWIATIGGMSVILHGNNPEDRMSALGQKRTFRLLLNIIVGGQGCSSSWSITRETSPSPILASHRRRCRAPSRDAHRRRTNAAPYKNAAPYLTGASDLKACYIQAGVRGSSCS